MSRQVLLKEMKIQNIAPHKKNLRSVCLGHKYGTVPEEDYREHEKRKEESRQEKKNDKQKAEGNDHIMVLTTNLQVDDPVGSTCICKCKLLSNQALLS